MAVTAAQLPVHFLCGGSATHWLSLEMLRNIAITGWHTVRITSVGLHACRSDRLWPIASLQCAARWLHASSACSSSTGNKREEPHDEDGLVIEHQHKLYSIKLFYSVLCDEKVMNREEIVLDFGSDPWRYGSGVDIAETQHSQVMSASRRSTNYVIKRFSAPCFHK